MINRQALLSRSGAHGSAGDAGGSEGRVAAWALCRDIFSGRQLHWAAEYEDMLQRANLTPAKFEEAVGNDILLTKLQALISGSASVSEAEIREQFIKQNSKVKFDYAVLKQDDLRKGLHPTETELKAFYESHKASYANSIPEKRKVKYAVVETSKIEAGLQVTQDDLRTYYDQHRDAYRVPEQVKVSHIWIKMPLPGTDGKMDDKKRWRRSIAPTIC